MADGVTHETAAVATGVCGIVGAVVVVSENSYLLVPAACFILGLANGITVTPDIDLVGITHEERRWLRLPLIGGIIGRLFIAFWYPYARIFAHRGLSHAPLLGTLTRAIYQFGAVWAFMALLGAIYPQRAFGGVWAALWPSPATWALWLTYLIGWSLQDCVHILFDVREDVANLIWLALLIVGQVLALRALHG